MDPLSPACALGPVVCVGVEGSDVVDAVGKGVDTVGAVADFWSDPAGNTFNMLQDANRGLSETVMPAITKATLPDLTTDWFLRSYAISFGLAIFVMVALLIPQLVRTARGQQSGRDTAEALGLYAPLFLISAAFGPAVGTVLVQFFGALTESIIAWGINTNSGQIVDQFTAMLSEEDNGEGLAGGAVIGVILLFLMLLGLLIVVLILIVQLITLYFTGILFPLGVVWIIDPTKRKFGTKIAYLWFGILASHPLLFFLLAVAYFMVGANLTVFSETPSLQRTVNLVVSLLALLMAGLSPLLLTKFAPVIPTGGMGSAPAGPTVGSSSMQQADSRVSQQSGSNTDNDSSGGGGGGGSSGGGGGGSSTQATGSAGSEAEEPTSSVTSATKGAGSGASAGETVGASTASGGAEAGAGAATGAAAAEGGMAAAGAAESATGVGAAVGVPTMLAAGAMAAAETGKKVNDAVAQTAVNPVEDHDEHYGKDSTNE
ncbi:hypothetical protein [Frigoribacterium sp. RIT-PI-h]|uniref:hypothetical protein n=1 Tax=Frigoribacterium sp. RIT-PI-h TaxID=1690245 RepID=UPI0006B9F3BA|nr:hypothetical protein [Frigoribacterium sp. RIT-PI-h]KPG82410.1 hypothetical protein AEQ27_09935 [Frigoribacterium sp. RIT-PI-h]